MDNKTKALDIAMSLIDCELPTLEKCRKSAIQMAEWKDQQYKELIEKLIDELNTSKLYHLGITGLDTDEEIAQKRKNGECALIRGIERTIKYAKDFIK